MDTQGRRYYRKSAKECDDRKSPSPQRLSSNRHVPGDQAHTPPDNVGYTLRQTSSLGGKLSRQTSNHISRQKSIHTDGRPEERRSLAQKLHLYPHRPHSSNTSRNSSTNTSSSSLQSLADNNTPGSEAGFAVAKHLSDSQHSSATLRAGESSHSAPLSPLSEHPPATTQDQPANHFSKQPSNDFPVYPDQSYAAVQNQVHPPTYKPPFLRSRSSYPSHFGVPTTLSWPRDPSSRPQGSRTVGNTPISSPGLFSSSTPRSASSTGSEDGRIRGSYLHPTHMQEPKETHTVEVDRDVLTGNKLINEYEILEELGRGEHGKVKLGRHLRTGQTVAIKIVQRYSKRRRLGKLGNPEDKVKKEVAILKKARHPNVVSLLEVIDDPNQQKVYIVLEYVENLEIVWRKKGLKEIVMVDKRRLQRDRQNIPDSPSFIEESQQFVLNTQMRRRKVEAARRKKRSVSVHGTGIPAWSLEHGAESDDEIGPEYCFRLPTNSSVNSQDPHSAQPSPGQSVSSAGEFDRRMRDAALAAVEGSMFGAYAPDPVFERRHSAASSHLAYLSSESEWLPDDDDMAYVPCLTLSEARGAFRDSVLGLEYLHYQGIIHRDIKPANLLVAGNRRVKISDFGVSYLGRPIRDDEEEQVAETDATELDDARELSKTVGTPAFYAPELCCTGNEFERTVGNFPKITGAIDVWSLGVTLYGMIFGRLPFVADDEFSLFQNIVKQEVFIPRKRLKAVEPDQPFNQSFNQSSSQKYPIMNSNKRMEDELVYEDVGDELRDLLSRLLIKDPAKRITLKEIKHHPWVLQGIQDPQSWIEETDPGYQSKGKKIEVTNDEVTRAVTKLPFIERVRSNVARWSSIFGRRRAPSSAASTDTAQSTSSQGGMAIGKDMIRELRRASLRGDEQITRTPRPYREGEHPLSQSVVPSPDSNESRDYFSSQRAGGPGISHTVPSSINGSPGPEYRPDLPERTTSTQSNAGSIKTIRPPNLDLSLTESRVLAPPLTIHDTPHLSNIGNLFTAPRRLVRSLNLRDRRREKSPSSDDISFDNRHSSPSVALSSASATGQVQTPDLFRQTSSTSEAAIKGHNIPSPSIAFHRRSRSYQYAHDASVDSNFAREYLGRSHQQPLEHAVYSETESTSPRPNQPRVSSIRTNVQDQFTQDHVDGSVKRDESSNNRTVGNTSIHKPITSPPSAATISSSSADDFTSGMSHCASHPSIPSVISGASSLSADGIHTYMAESKRDGICDTCSEVPPLLRTDDTVTTASRSQKGPDDDLRYHGDDEDGDSSDEGLTFGRNKCKGKPLPPSQSRPHA